MSFTDAFSKSTSTAVYTAVLQDGENSNCDLKESLLPTNSSNTSTQAKKPTCPSFLLLLSGSCFGVVAALLGLFWLANGSSSAVLGDHHDQSTVHVFWFALAWSSATAITAYAAFSLMIRCFGNDNREEEDDDESNLASEPYAEYNFALGVFAGFCATCTVHDATHGVPVTSLLLTAGIAAFWGLLMTATVRKSTTTTTTKVRTGTKLPMPAFMV